MTLSNNISSTRYFCRSLARHWIAYVCGTLALLLTSTTEILTPKFTQWTIDLLTAKDAVTLKVPSIFLGATRVETLRFMVEGFLVLAAAGWFGRWAWRQTLARRTHAAGREMKVEYWDALRFQPIKTFHDYTLGDLMNRATADWNASRFIHGFTIVLTYDLIFFSILAVTTMVMIDPWLTCVSLAAFIVLPPFMVKLARLEYTQHVWAQEKLSELSNVISQAIATVRLQRASADEGFWQGLLNKEARTYANRRREVIKTEWKIFPLGAFPTVVAYAILIFYGIHHIRSGALSLGEFVAFQSYVLMLQIPLFELNACITEWQRGFGSLGRILEIIIGGRRVIRGRLTNPKFSKETESDLHLGLVRRPLITHLALEELRYSYPGQSRAIIDRVSLVLKPGERMGLSGPIGSGKTTFLRIIVGLLDQYEGRIFLLGQDISEIPRTQMNQYISFVTQEAFLFAGSVRYNLLLSDDIDDDTLWAVLETVDLAKDIRKLPNQLDTWIGEWGITLSGGQRQRLSLARALVRLRPLLLLDDCFSAIDSVTEEVILERVEKFFTQTKHDVTIIWTAHRASTLALCEKKYELDTGQLILR